jgi:hypothetical protein
LRVFRRRAHQPVFDHESREERPPPIDLSFHRITPGLALAASLSLQLQSSPDCGMEPILLHFVSRTVERQARPTLGWRVGGGYRPDPAALPGVGGGGDDGLPAFLRQGSGRREWPHRDRERLLGRSYFPRHRNSVCLSSSLAAWLIYAAAARGKSKTGALIAIGSARESDLGSEPRRIPAC